MATQKTTSEKSFADIEKTFEPMRALNQLALDNAAKLMEMNLDVAKRYSNMMLSSAREMIELKDPAALQAFVAKQPEAIKSFTDVARADAEAAVKLGMTYFEQAGKLVSESAKKAA